MRLALHIKESTMDPSKDQSGPPPPAPSGTPLLDPQVLHDLAGDVGPRAASSFAREFAGMWPRRRAALTSALAHEDADGAMDAVLSMRVSSAMVGARRLEDLVARLEGRLRTQGLTDHAGDLAAFVEDLEACGEETARALTAHGESEPLA
jgi:HPt (histidine-containing phosphotransfer) domain-containing protein